MRAVKRGRVKRAFAVAAAVLAAACVADYFGYPWGQSIVEPSGNRGENGLWLRYTHYFGEKSDDAVAATARALEERRIRWAYFHVRFVERSGRLHFRYPEQAKRLLATVRRANPDLRCLAWVYAGNARGEGNVDLAKPEVRKVMVDEARWLVEVCGFDGIQWDYEICPDGDKHLLSLLDETRAALGPERPLGVCAPAWLPIPGVFGWSEAYLAQVAARCDQVAVMAYDSGFVVPRAYVWLVRENVVRCTRAVRAGNPKATVMLGVPTYGSGFRSHNPRAENLANALRGVREGLAQPGTVRDAFAGVAPFADYTTDADEWAIWRRDW